MQAGQPERWETVAPTGRRRRTTAAWVLLAVLLLASGALFVQRLDAVAHSRRTAFDAETDEIVAGVERGLKQCALLIDDIAAIAGDDGRMSRDDFLAAIDSEALSVEHPAAYAVIVTERVSRDELNAFVERLQPAEDRRLILLDSLLGPPAGDYQIAVHAAPEALRSGAVGVDGRAFAPADQSLDDAVETGEVALSPAVPQSTFELTPSGWKPRSNSPPSGLSAATSDRECCSQLRSPPRS